LKDTLTNTQILACPLPIIVFFLETDGSDICVGAILSQTQDDHEKVIAYMSKSLDKHEQLYCTMRKELLAVITSSSTFHSYRYGQTILLRTDNSVVR
jgi:hypothetical protein